MSGNRILGGQADSPGRERHRERLRFPSSYAHSRLQSHDTIALLPGSTVRVKNDSHPSSGSTSFCDHNLAVERSEKSGMTTYSIWPYFACTVFLLAIAASPLLKAADAPPNPRGARISTLDGLRGFLALGVFFHHAAFYHEYLLYRQWWLPSRFYTLLGHVGVAMFFMITGYLFWSRIVAERNRLDWLQLYIGRVFRIGPLYLFAFASVLLIVFARGGWHLNVPISQFIKELARWVSLGLFWPHDINNYENTTLILAGVTWTLKFEWDFYLSLPLLALVASRPKVHLPFSVGALMISLAYLGMPHEPTLRAISIAWFLTGMTCGSLAYNGMTAKIRDSLASIIVGTLICTIFIAFDSGYNIGVTMLLGGAFYLLSSGCSFFGLLTSRPARRLGNVSYGIYLLQGLVLTVVLSVHWARSTALRSPLGHWSVILLCAVLLVVVATVTHVGIERTGIDLGKRLGRAVRARNPLAFQTGLKTSAKRG